MEWLTQWGLVLDIVGVGLLGFAGAITQRFLQTYNGAPTPEQARKLAWTEKPGWAALGFGFALQFVGSFSG